MQKNSNGGSFYNLVVNNIRGTFLVVGLFIAVGGAIGTQQVIIDSTKAKADSNAIKLSNLELEQAKRGEQFKSIKEAQKEIKDKIDLLIKELIKVPTP